MNRSMPPGIVIPEIPYPDVHQAADWLCQTFGFSERLRIGNHRIQLTFGEGSLVVIQQLSPSSQSIMVRVSDIDQHYERAKHAGAQIIKPPTDYSYGERQYTATDPGGHRWTFSQTIADVDPGTWDGILVE